MTLLFKLTTVFAASAALGSSAIAADYVPPGDNLAVYSTVDSREYADDYGDDDTDVFVVESAHSGFVADDDDDDFDDDYNDDVTDDHDDHDDD